MEGSNSKLNLKKILIQILNPVITGTVRFTIFFPILLLLYPIKRDNSLWAIMGMNVEKFRDNTKYLFLYTQNNEIKDLKFIYITSNKMVYQSLKRKGYSVVYLYSIRGIWTLIRAGGVIVDNLDWSLKHFGIIYALTSGARKVQLWHGIPIKKIELDNKKDRLIQLFKEKNPSIKTKLLRLIYYPRYVRYDTVLSPSQSYKKIFASAFGVPAKNILVANYPRNEFLLNSETFGGWDIGIDNETLKILKQRKKEGYKIVLYLPTFRDTNRPAISKKELLHLSSKLHSQGIILAIKPHPWDRSLRELLSKFDCKNIVVIRAEEDPYPYLHLANALITDVSSIQFDYLLLNRPIVYFMHDYSQYKKRDREVYVDLNEIVNIEPCEDITCVIKEVIENINKMSPKMIKRQLKLKRTIFGTSIMTGCKEIVKHLTG